MTRLTRPTRQSPTCSDFFALHPEDEDLLMEQSLLEAVGQVQTPTTPSARSGRRSRRASSHPPTYDPEQPNAQGDALPYDPATWNLLSSNSSGSGSRRSSMPVLRQTGTARYSPTTPAYSPWMRSQRQTEQYDPRTPLYGRPGRLYDPTTSNYNRHSVSVVAGGEPSPGYSHNGGYGQPSPTTASVTARLDNIFEILRSLQGQIDARAGRLDRLEAQLTAIADFLTDELNGSTPTVNRSSDSLSSGSNKRKRWLKKRVSFTTSDSDDDDDEDEDGPSTPSKKPRTFASPKTPSNKRTANLSTPPKAPRKAAPKRLAPDNLSSSSSSSSSSSPSSSSSSSSESESKSESSTSSKKLKTSASPKTPSNKHTANLSTPPKAPRKAAPKRPATQSQAQAPSTPARQTGRTTATPAAPRKAAPKRPAPPSQAPSTPARQTGRATATPAAPRKETITATPVPAPEPERVEGALRRSLRTAAVPPVDYSDVKRKKTKEVPGGGLLGKCGTRRY